MDINYVTDIVRETDPQKRKENLAELISQRTPSELLVLTAISVLSKDKEIRRTALQQIEKIDKEEGNASAGAICLIKSWRTNGALLTYPRPMTYEQNQRANEIELAYYSNSPLSAAVAE